MTEYTKLRDIIDTTLKGITPKYVRESNVIVLNQKCIRNNKIDYSFARLHDHEKSFSDEKILRMGDIIINSTGQGTAGRCTFVHELPEDSIVTVDSHILIVRIKDFFTAACVEYSLFSIENQLQDFMDGSTGQGEFDKQRLFNVLMRLPTYKSREVVYSFLHTLDDKIELNNKINVELEAMAKTLYDYWFVQFDFPDKNGKPYKSSGGKMIYNKKLKREIPEGWKNGTMDQLGSIVGGSTPSTKEKNNYIENGTPWITPKDLSDSVNNKYISRGARDVTDQGIKDAALKIYPRGTILLSSRAPVGYMAIARNNLTTNQGFKSIIPDKNYSIEFIYYTVQISLNIIIQYSSGSTFNEISGAVLKTVQIILPPKEICDEYTHKMTAVFKKQNNIELENQKLTELRNWLLPMLMNGQVTIK